jgi:hypothetical protein
MRVILGKKRMRIFKVPNFKIPEFYLTFVSSPIIFLNLPLELKIIG